MPTVRLTARFSISADRYNWFLYEKVPGFDREGRPKDSTRTTYHPSLSAICREIIDSEAGGCKTALAIINKIEETKKELMLSIEKNRRALFSAPFGMAVVDDGATPQQEEPCDEEAEDDDAEPPEHTPERRRRRR